MYCNDSSGIEVLLIEDNDHDAQFLLILLAQINTGSFHVVHAERLESALEMLQAGCFDVVIADLRLPDSNGIETLTRIRELFPRVPVIVLTGLNDAELGVLALKKGAQDFLEKGHFDEQVLGRAIRYAIERHRTNEFADLERDFAERLIETVPALVFLLDTNGVVLRVNRFAAKFVQSPGDDLVGRNFLDELLPPTHRLSIRQRIEQGCDAWTLDDVCPLSDCEGGIHQIQWQGRNILNPQRHAWHILVTGHDVTDLQQAQQLALRNERLAAVGQVVTALAHESRNALQRSFCCLEMLDREVHDHPKALNYVSRLERAQQDLQHILEDVRNYAAPSPVRRTRCRLVDVVRRCWEDLAEMRLQREATLTVEKRFEMLEGQLDCRRIEQVFRNLFENALEACRDPVRLQVDGFETQIDSQRAAEVRVCDNGPGISLEDREHAFEAFYSKKQHGTGLGLAICSQIIKLHGGTIEIVPSEMRGAEFVIALPLGEIQ